METKICFDVWYDEEADNFFGDVCSFDPKSRKSKDIETTESMSSASEVKKHVLTKYPNAICIHCG